MKLTMSKTLNVVQQSINGTPNSKVGGTVHVPFNNPAFYLDQRSKGVGFSKNFHFFLVLFHNIASHIDYIALNTEI